MTSFKDLASKYKEPIFRPAESPNIKCGRIPTGIATLDLVLEGGIPMGRVTEFYGAFATLKTLTAMSAVREALELYPDRNVLYFDYERTIDDRYMRSAGVDFDHPNFYFSQPTYGEIAFDMAIDAAGSGEVSLIVIDSLPTMQPRAIIEGSTSDAAIGAHARMVARGISKIVPVLATSNTALLIVNQIRVNISGYGSPTLRPGGKSLDHYASLLVGFTKSQIKKGEEIVGALVTAKIEKSKVCKPFTTADFRMLWDTGLDLVGSIVDVAEEKQIIVKGGAWYTIGDQKFQGKDNLVKFLNENPNQLDMIREAIISQSEGGES